MSELRKIEKISRKNNKVMDEWIDGGREGKEVGGGGRGKE